jgi:hypothetical protein
MSTRKRSHTLEVGDRARARTTLRTGRIDRISTIDGRRHYTLSYDEAPQDRFLATSARHGGEFPRELIEPE